MAGVATTSGRCRLTTIEHQIFASRHGLAQPRRFSRAMHVVQAFTGKSTSKFTDPTASRVVKLAVDPGAPSSAPATAFGVPVYIAVPVAVIGAVAAFVGLKKSKSGCACSWASGSAATAFQNPPDHADSSVPLFSPRSSVSELVDRGYLDANRNKADPFYSGARRAPLPCV